MFKKLMWGFNFQARWNNKDGMDLPSHLKQSQKQKEAKYMNKLFLKH